jgi:hypothetical protein
VQAARIFLNEFNIHTILVFTDSQAAIEEALRCATDYPQICSGIKFRYLEKKRWHGAEGGRGLLTYLLYLYCLQHDKVVVHHDCYRVSCTTVTCYYLFLTK